MVSAQPWVLAIDFGTTATAAATLSGAQMSLVRIDGDDRMPSMVFWREGEDGREGELLLGDLADRWAALAPECLERAPKRRIGDEYLVLGSARIPVAKAIAAVLGKVRDAAAVERGGAPGQLYLTHPARWWVDGPQVEQLREAALLAGLPEPALVAEPVAAAIYFATEELAMGEYVAVYDFGGGTFDTAVLQRVPDGFEVVGEPGGDDYLGGNDFDDRLYRWLGSQLPASDWENLRTNRTGGWRQTNRQLLREARIAKEHLSRNSDAPVYVPAPVDRDILVNAGQLRELIADDVQATVEELERTIHGAGLKPDQLAAIYLAGGSSAIPLVSSLISERLGKVPRTLFNPKTVVASGAALAALHAEPEFRPGLKPKPEPQRKPEPEPKPEPQPEPEPQPKPDPERMPGPEPVIDDKTEPELDSERKQDATEDQHREREEQHATKPAQQLTSLPWVAALLSRFSGQQRPTIPGGRQLLDRPRVARFLARLSREQRIIAGLLLAILVIGLIALAVKSLSSSSGNTGAGGNENSSAMTHLIPGRSASTYAATVRWRLSSGSRSSAATGT